TTAGLRASCALTRDPLTRPVLCPTVRPAWSIIVTHYSERSAAEADSRRRMGTVVLPVGIGTGHGSGLRCALGRRGFERLRVVETDSEIRCQLVGLREKLRWYGDVLLLHDAVRVVQHRPVLREELFPHVGGQA